MPQFPGGDIELLKFFGTNIRYPKVAKENDVQGIVIIAYTIYEEVPYKILKLFVASIQALQKKPFA